MLTDLTNIPRIMRGLGWLNGAQLLEKWFSRPAKIVPKYTAPDTTTIRMNSWVLTFPRAKGVYDEILTQRIWENQKAQAEIAKMLRRRGLLGTIEQNFGAPTKPVPEQDRDYINERSIGLSPRVDDMTAALARFTLRVVIVGRVTPQPTTRSYDVAISRAGVYVRDSFDFEGDQPLGCWSDTPDGFSLIPPIETPPPGALRETATYQPVFNNTFRDWRSRTGRGETSKCSPISTGSPSQCLAGLRFAKAPASCPAAALAAALRATSRSRVSRASLRKAA